MLRCSGFPESKKIFEIDFKKSISRCLLSLTSFAPGRGHQPSPLLFSLLPQTLSFPCFIPKLGPDHILFNSLFLWQLYNEMIISVSMGLHSLQIFFPDWSKSILTFLFLILCQTFLAKANYVTSLYLVKTRRHVPAEMWRQAEIWTLLCFLSPSSPHKSFPSSHYFCFSQRKSITYFWKLERSPLNMWQEISQTT